VIARFIFNRFEDVRALLADEDFDLDEDVKLLVPLLEKLFVTFWTLESDDSSLAAVVPEIEKLAEFLLHQGMKLGGEMAAIYEAAAMTIRFCAFEKGNWIFQLAYVLTPTGREGARGRRLHAPIPRSPLQSQGPEMMILMMTRGHMWVSPLSQRILTRTVKSKMICCSFQKTKKSLPNRFRRTKSQMMSFLKWRRSNSGWISGVTPRTD
jgi:hypothetical protein